jgi:hypothetical protein
LHKQGTGCPAGGKQMYWKQQLAVRLNNNCARCLCNVCISKRGSWLSQLAEAFKQGQCSDGASALLGTAWGRTAGDIMGTYCWGQHGSRQTCCIGGSSIHFAVAISSW